LHPVEYVSHGHEVDVSVVGADIIHPVLEGETDLGVGGEEGRVEEQRHRSTVGVVVAAEVVVEELVELLACGFAGEAGVHHSTTWKGFFMKRVFPSVEFVHDHFPDGEGAGGAVLEVTVALMGHAVVQHVWPQGEVRDRGSNSGVVEETTVLHHVELVIASDPQEGASHAQDGVIGDVSKALDDFPGTSHLLSPVLFGSVGPEGGVSVVADGVDSDLVATMVKLFNSSVVGVLVGDEESGPDVASVGVGTATEELIVEVDVVVVDSVVEGDHNHLRDSLGVHLAGSLCGVVNAVAVGQCTLGLVAERSSVGVLVHAAGGLI